MSVLTQLRATNNDTESMQSLLEGFLGNYRAFKAGEINLDDEEKYNLFGIPGPFQYLVFSDFLIFSKKKNTWSKII